MAYTRERNHQILISLLKSHSISKVIVSPGATNVAFVASIQNDPFFEIYSCVDERSAAYMACGLSAESGEPVVISCTGATASRNYMPGLTEAYYRKLPVLAITSSHRTEHVGHLIPQVTNRDILPADIVYFHTTLPTIESSEEEWHCTIKANEAILATKRHGGGPVHINLETSYGQSYDVSSLPPAKRIDRFEDAENLPKIASSSVAIFIGSMRDIPEHTTQIIDSFCDKYNAVVFSDHTSGYYGKHKFPSAIIGAQEEFSLNDYNFDILIHIGEISGDYESQRLASLAGEVWRVNKDGEIRDTFRKLRYVFEMSESSFFKYYLNDSDAKSAEYTNSSIQEKFKDLYQRCINAFENTEIPFSNIWVASKIAPKIPTNSIIHLSILNTLRSWNLFSFPNGVRSNCNVGGFGIDGQFSSLVGASFANRDKLYFGIMGDLSYFYDMNIQGNRHIQSNVRILLINNGIGSEFTMYNHAGSIFGQQANKYIAAEGHFGNKSANLVKHFAEDLGFEYISARNKEEFESVVGLFLQPDITDKPIFFEAFTNYTDESDALKATRHLIRTKSIKSYIKSAIRR